jgi:transposase
MGTNFRPLDRDTLLLLPPSLHDWLPANHLARFISDIVAKLDLRAIRAEYRGSGTAAYQPEMLLALLCYGYATGVFSSRKLERATYESVAFRFLTADQHPEHDTIATFRRRFLSHVTAIFEQVLSIAAESGVLKIGRVSLDGTKMKANASKHHALSYQHGKDLKRQIQAEVQQLLRRAEQADREDEDDGLDLPQELTRREDRLRVIDDALKRIKEREQERIDAEQADYQEKLSTYKEKEALRKSRGKKPVRPSKKISPKAQINLTDEESRIMPVSGGGFIQGYNAQNVVDCESRLLVSTFVSQSANDMGLLPKSIAQLMALPESLGRPKELLADAGYFSERNLTACESAGITPYISDRRERHGLRLQDMAEPKPLASDAPIKDRARHRLRTRNGRAIYGLRKSTIEPIFGIIKAAMGFRDFLLRGLEKVTGEWKLVSLAYNMRRLQVLQATC